MDERSKKDGSISPADKLVTTGRKGDIHLTEEELEQVAGGTEPVHKLNQTFLKIKSANTA
jgi:hypothetical protein